MENVIEPAKSGRATCRTCRKKIEKGALRFGESMESQFDPDGTSLLWHHLECAAKKVPDKVKPVLAAYTGDVPDRAALEQTLASAKKSADRAFPYAERAPSGRSRCLECEETIPKGEWRVAIEREIDTGSFVRTGAGYLHPKCAEAHAGDIWEEVEANSELEPAELDALRAARA